jgi:protein-disulfide isomerase
MKELATPISIVIAGAFIALAVFFASGGTQGITDNSNEGSDFGNNGSNSASLIRAVSDDDHILGNPDAKVTIVEFSDYECPFCAQAHTIFEQVVEESNGEVNWAYRHFPLSSIHANAVNAAIASECVAQIGGNDAFWEFSKKLLQNQRGLGLEFYVQEAGALGVDESALLSCVNDSSVAEEVNADFDEAVAAGGRGTPFSVIISANGEFLPFSGALPYDKLKPLIEQALEN